MEKIDKILTICALSLILIWLSFSACNTIALFNCESDCELYEERGLLSISLILQALGFLAVIRVIVISIKKKLAAAQILTHFQLWHVLSAKHRITSITFRQIKFLFSVQTFWAGTETEKQKRRCASAQSGA